MKVVLDGVFNHASRGFFQFHDILENGVNAAYLDWFTVHSYPLNAYDSQNQPGYQAWWNLPALPKFNVRNPEVRNSSGGSAANGSTWASTAGGSTSPTRSTTTASGGSFAVAFVRATPTPTSSAKSGGSQTLVEG